MNFVRTVAFVGVTALGLWIYCPSARADAAPLVTTEAGETDALRLCKPEDIRGYWLMQDQLIARSFEQSSEGRRLLETRPKYFPYQFLSFSKDGEAGDVTHKGYTAKGKDTAREEGMDVKKNLEYLRSVPSEMHYIVRSDGMLIWKNAKGQTTTMALCNVVKKSFPFFNHPTTAKAGDLLIGELECTPSVPAQKMTAIQLFRRARE